MAARSVRIQFYRQTGADKGDGTQSGKHPFTVGVSGVDIASPEVSNPAGYLRVKWMCVRSRTSSI